MPDFPAGLSAQETIEMPTSPRAFPWTEKIHLRTLDTVLMLNRAGISQNDSIYVKGDGSDGPIHITVGEVKIVWNTRNNKIRILPLMQAESDDDDLTEVPIFSTSFETAPEEYTAMARDLTSLIQLEQFAER